MISHLTLAGIRTESTAGTFLLGSSITGQPDVGKPVSMSTATDFTVELAENDAEILGQLESVEDRMTQGVRTGAVTTRMFSKFTYSGAAPTRGGHVVGDGSGGVKAAGAGQGLNTVVVAVDTANNLVEVLIK